MLDDTSTYKMKVSKLMNEYNQGRLPDNEFIESFLPRVAKKIRNSWELTTKEKACIDQLFDQY